MAGTITLWVFGLLCFVVAFAKEAASGAGISLPGPKSGGARVGVVAVGILALILGTAIRPQGGTPAEPAPAAGAAVSPQGAAAPGAATASAGAGTTATAAPAPPAPSPTGLAAVWTGQVGIPFEGGIDLDLTPPGRHPGFPQGIYATGFSSTEAVLRDEIQMDHDTFGLWTGQAPPSGPACADWAASHAGDSVHVKAGSLVCLRTPGGRTALIKVDSIAPADYQVEATVTLWAG
ncbi:hypothetical protein ACIG0C_06970 [Kitasatospora aureofaciens]|uniref:Uncharacterized protein n=1 Tax=Kitasatospora aureofaciens TaxID=1894 RepID=A0A8H9LRZ7_KITAU|nr:hypothetical protein [Kitasatospora aureofaciens]GGU71287.1 hypothetical protein GCM10010502_23740 [Kitasatospora aureofaciens]